MALACVDGGADLLEIGVPFSDPIADGPTIQLAAERALARGTSPRDCLDVVRAVRKKSQVPVALMGYLNPMLAQGLEAFVPEAAAAGVDAFIIPDLLPEEAGELARAGGAPRHRPGLPARPHLDAGAGRGGGAGRPAGFLYFVSVTGVTGARAALPTDLAEKVAAVRPAEPGAGGDRLRRLRRRSRPGRSAASPTAWWSAAPS